MWAKWNKKTSVARGMIQTDWELIIKNKGRRYVYTGNNEEEFLTMIEGENIQPVAILPKHSEDEPLEIRLNRSIGAFKRKEQANG